MLTYGHRHFTNRHKGAHVSQKVPDPPDGHKGLLLPSVPRSMVLLPWAFTASVSPFPLSVLPGLNGLCGWSINSVIQGVDSCSHVSVCSQACRRDGPRPVPLCLPWSLNRLEVNGGPCAEVAGAWMEPPLTWRSHRGRTGPDHCDTC